MMKRTIALLITGAMLFGLVGCTATPQATGAPTSTATQAAEGQSVPSAEHLKPIGDITITKDGHRYQTAACQDGQEKNVI